MIDEELKAELDRLEPFEGRVPWMYLDSAAHPNVTCGVGYLLSNADAACSLPFVHLDGETPATIDEIRADFHRVISLPGGLRASAYKGPLRLSQADIDAEGFRRLRGFLKGLPGVFPGFEGFPDGVQQALLDLAWNVGLGGLAKWSHLCAACNSVPPNWEMAAANCRTANPSHNPQREHRNDWRSSCFVSCVSTS
jgi:hypothetical protein